MAKSLKRTLHRASLLLKEVERKDDGLQGGTVLENRREEILGRQKAQQRESYRREIRQKSLKEGARGENKENSEALVDGWGELKGEKPSVQKLGNEKEERRLAEK